MAVDIVINWAADGVVLCFIHAVVDISERDNDEVHKTGWTNWCGTPHMSEQQVELLFTRLMQHIPHPPSMDRVFQILLNDQDRRLYFSWPADRQQVQGGPVGKDFAKLAAEVSIGSTTNNTDAKTSCTRRYKAQQNMPWGSAGSRNVESIFIPYGKFIARFLYYFAQTPAQVLLSLLVTKSTRIAPARTALTLPTRLSSIIMMAVIFPLSMFRHHITPRLTRPRRPRLHILRIIGLLALRIALSPPTNSGRLKIPRFLLRHPSAACVPQRTISTRNRSSSSITGLPILPPT